MNSSSFITTAALADWLAGRPIDARLTGSANAMARQLRFFHWPLEFPEVFANGEERTANGASEQPLAIRHSPFAPQTGFDLILGNPPWERIKLQEQEFFATRDPRIAGAPNKAARQRLIDELPRTNPALAAEFARAKHEHEAASKFVRASDRFPLTARGDINTYALFAELARRLLAPGGRAGIIVPTGIATDDTCKTFFADLNERRALASLFDFENREGLFPGVHRSYKFCLLTLRGVEEANGEQPAANSEQRMANGKQAKPPADHSPLATRHSPPAEFAFFLTRAEQLRDVRRRFSLEPEDLALLNPNTRTCPVFRTRADAELTRAIYRRVPVLVREANGEQRMANGVKPPADHSPLATRYSPSANPWGVRFSTMFHMANDSHLFRTREQLEQDGFRLVGNAFVKGDPHSPLAIRYSPLYEAKMIWQFDHRWATYEKGETRDCTEAEKQDPHFTVRPRYWVAEAEVLNRLASTESRPTSGAQHHSPLAIRHSPPKWLLGFRYIARSTDERTAIFSLLPRVGVGNKIPLLLLGITEATRVACLLANFDGLVFDYAARQKVGGTTLNFFIVQQFPVLPPTAYSEADLAFIVPRVVELVYTAWDLQPFAADVWEGEQGAANGERRIANSALQQRLRQLILQQWEANHGRPAPFAIDHSPFALSPFKWDAPRRALLRAELDAYFARLYGLTRKQLRYILDPADLTPRELADILDPWEEVGDPLDPAGYAARCAASDFPGETFRVLKEKELARWGEYRTRRLVLEAWARLGVFAA